MNNLKHFIKKWRVKLLISKTSKVLYANNIPISTEIDRIAFFNELSKGKSKLSILKIYLVIQYLTKNISYSTFYKPIGEQAVYEILNEVEEIEKYSKYKRHTEYQEALNASLNLHRIKADWYLSLACHYFERGHEAYKINEFSFEGMRYIREKNKKRPLTLKEQEICKKSANKISELEMEVREAEEAYQSAVSRQAAQRRIEQIIKEVKDAQTTEEKSVEDIHKDREKIIKDIKEKLNRNNQP